MQNLALLKEVLAKSGEVQEGVYESLKEFVELLYRWSEKLNLLSHADREKIVEKHLVPSIRLANVLRLVPHHRIIDFGSGAGLPGIPVKVLFPESSVVLVESRRRRANYLKQVARSLRLENIETIHGRLEETSPKELQADVVISRAVLNQRALVSVVEPYIRPGGALVCTSPTEEKSIPKLMKVGEQPQIHLI